MAEAEVYRVTVHWADPVRKQDTTLVILTNELPEETIATCTIVDQDGHVRKFPWHAVRLVEWYTGGEG